VQVPAWLQQVIVVIVAGMAQEYFNGDANHPELLWNGRTQGSPITLILQMKSLRKADGKPEVMQKQVASQFVQRMTGR